MKKSILAIAIALSVSSGAAFATGNGWSPTSSNTSITSGAEAHVGGQVSSGATGNQGGYIYQESSAEAMNVTGAQAGANFGRTCNAGAGCAGAATGSAGYAVTESHGIQAGNASGQNGAQAGFHGSASANGSVDTRPMDLDAYSNSSVEGYAQTGVNGEGYAIQGTGAAAGNMSGISGNYYDGRALDTASIEGDTVGASGSISGGYVEGNAGGSAGSYAQENGGVYGRVAPDGRNGDAVVRGGAHQGTDAGSSNVGTGLAGAGSVSGAGFSADAYNLDLRGREYSRATADDYKGSASGSFEYGGGSAGTGGAANAGADAWAGDRYQGSQP